MVESEHASEAMVYCSFVNFINFEGAKIYKVSYLAVLKFARFHTC